MIHLQTVSFAYDGHVALRDITLDVLAGETVILRGSNGCGKSTLLRLLAGLIYPEVGTYTFSGDVIDAKSMKVPVFSKKFHQRIGFVFQDSDVQLFCGSVREEIEFGPLQMGLSPNEIKQRTEDVMTMLGIEHLAGRAPYHLSGGEKKKAAIAAVLSMNPDVLLFDEPLAGLDAKSQHALLQLLQNLQRAGKTLVVATHDEALTKALGGRVMQMTDDHRMDAPLHDE